MRLPQPCAARYSQSSFSKTTSVWVSGMGGFSNVDLAGHGGGNEGGAVFAH
jgi:hypothetical protein